MDKRIMLLAIFVVMIVSVAIAYSSYYERIIVMQEHRMNVSGPAPINLVITNVKHVTIGITIHVLT